MVKVFVAVGVGVLVGVGEIVSVGVKVGVIVAVGVWVAVGVKVGVDVLVEDGVLVTVAVLVGTVVGVVIVDNIRKISGRYTAAVPSPAPLAWTVPRPANNGSNNTSQNRPTAVAPNPTRINFL
ncbi:MAG: hypothetical protein KF770_24780 [Anaerolineae bacterium]|nr:hypothetical protein [Anaerolineae bacterium]